MNYYNEHDLKTAAWLRQLIADGLIPHGDVDTRSITEVTPGDVRGYTQCHFFAGIGGWSLALQLARWPATRPVWTGSCPYQPFSAAGKGAGIDDDRHLWPVFFELIRQGEPETVFGEQVASAEVVGSKLEAAFLVAVQAGDYSRVNKIAKQLAQSSAFHYHSKWLDRVSADLESAGYAVGASVLGAHSAGAPHIRQRLYWVAHAKQSRREAAGLRSEKHPGRELEPGCSFGGLGESNGDRRESGQLATEAAGHGDSPQSAGGGYSRVAQPHIQHDDRSGSCTGDDSGEQPGAPILCQQPDFCSGLGNSTGRGCGIGRDETQQGSGGHADSPSGTTGRLAHTPSHSGPEHVREPRGGSRREAGERDAAERGGDHGGMENPNGIGQQGQGWLGGSGDSEESGGQAEHRAFHASWGDYHLIPCRDGKHRRIPTEPALFPLVDGFSYKLGARRSVRPALLHGAGNAIVPQVAALFIEAFSHIIDNTTTQP